MTLTLEKATEILSLTDNSMPDNDAEVTLLLELVRGWLIDYGETEVRDNPLLRHEWKRQRALLKEKTEETEGN